MKISAEKPLLSALLKSPASIDKITSLISADDFENTDCRLIYLAICKLVTDGTGVDSFSVHNLVDKRIDLNVIIELAVSHGTPENVIHYANSMAEASIIRKLTAAGQEITAIAGDDSLDVQKRLDSAYKRLNSVLSKTGDNIGFSDRMIKNWVAAMDERCSRDSGIQGISTGIKQLDEITSGLGRGDLIIIAGRPSMGKTAFALSIADEMLKNEQSVYIESIEMTEQKLIDRMISRRSKVDLAKIKTAKMADCDWSQVTTAAAAITKNKLAISESSSPSVFEIMSRCRRVAQIQKLDVVIIDYLQLMGGGSGENETLRIGNITRELKGLAKTLNVPVILISQLNRGVEQRADKRPLMADLRQSGAIEQDADLIIFMYREWVYDKSKKENLGLAIVAKNRDGSLADVPLIWECRNAAYYEFFGEYNPDDSEPKQYKYKPRYAD